MRKMLMLIVVALAMYPSSSAEDTPAAIKGQTVISNETLVGTTLVVNKENRTANCEVSGCRAKTQMLAPVQVTCPASTGQTCTFHISLDTKVRILLHANGQTSGPTGFYQFLIDDAAPTIGPTNKDGDYLFERHVYTWETTVYASRQSYPASVVTSVKNSNSNRHTIIVNLGCVDDIGNLGGCEARANWSTMRVDVFEP